MRPEAKPFYFVNVWTDGGVVYWPVRCNSDIEISRVRLPVVPLSCNDSEQVVPTLVLLSTSGIIRYWPKGGDCDLGWEGYCTPGGKYRQPSYR